MTGAAGGGRRLGLAHLGLVVRDLPAMCAFCEGVIGLRVSDRGRSPRRGREMVFLTGDATVHHQLVLIDGGTEAPPAPGLDHVAFAAESLGALRALRDRARTAGVPLRAVDHGNAWSVYLTAPEGGEVEVFVRSPFEVPQPYGRPLAIDMGDAEIIAATRSAASENVAGRDLAGPRPTAGAGSRGRQSLS